MLTEDFVESWDELNHAEGELLCFRVEDPELLPVMFHAADVCVWSK